MGEYEAFSAALKNLREIYNYNEPYENIVLAGFSVLYREYVKRALELMGTLMEKKGYPGKDTGYPRQVLKAAGQRGLIKNLRLWLRALDVECQVDWDNGSKDISDYVDDVKDSYFPMFCEFQEEVVKHWLVETMK